MTTGLSGPSFRSDVQESTRTAGSSPSAATTATPKGVGAGSVAPADGNQNYVPPFVEPTPEFPQLPLPTDQKAQNQQQGLTLPPNPDDVYNDNLSSLVKQLALKDSKLALLVEFIIAHPGGNYATGDLAKAAKLAQQFQQQALSFTKTSTGDSGFTAPTPDTGAADEELATQREGLFENIVNDNKTLTAQEKATLILAYNHPELMDKGTLSTKLQQLLTKYTNAAQRLFDATGAAPKGYTVPKNTSGFDLKASNDFSDLFQQAADTNGAAATPPFGENEMNYLLYILNNPEGSKPSLPAGRTAQEMDAFFNKTMSDAKALYTKQTNFPSSFTPKVDPSFFNAKLLANFENAFEANLNTQSPPLTEEQKLMLRTALGQQPENIPKEIKALFEVIKGSALAEVIKAFDLPTDWSPKTRSLSDPKVIRQRANAEHSMNAVAGTQEMLNALGGIVDQMSEGPQKVTMRAYLKAVADALQKISISLMTTMVIDSNVSTKLTKATTQTQLDMIKIQQHQANESWKKQQQAAKMNNVLSVVMAIFMFPIGIALAVQKMETGTNFFEQLAKKIMTSIEKLDVSPLFKAVLKAMANSFLSSVALVLGGPIMWMQQVQEGMSNSIADFLQVMGVPQDKAKMAGMITSIVLMILAEILITVLSGGAGASLFAGSFGSIMNMVSSVVKNALRVVAEVLKDMAKFITKELPKIVANASKVAQKLADRLQQAYSELNKLQRAIEKAAKIAREAPNAANIAKVEEAVKNMEIHLQKIQELYTKLARQLEMEARAASKPAEEARALMEGAAKVQKQANNMTQTVTDFNKFSAEIAQAVATQSAKGIRNEKRMNNFIKGFSYVSIGLAVVSSSVGLTRELLLGQVAMIKAEMEADTIKLRAIIKAIRAVIDDVLSGLGNTGEQVKNVQKQINNMFRQVQFVC